MVNSPGIGRNIEEIVAVWDDTPGDVNLKQRNQGHPNRKSLKI
jgi:hypothetical protein